MKITISFQHLEHTPSLDERIREKSEKMKKYFDGNLNIKWNCYVEDLNHFAEVTMFGPQFEYHAKAHSDSLYKTIDLCVEKLEKQVVKRKEKVKNRMHRKVKDPVILDIEAAWASKKDEDVA